jgi:DNA-binding transcriptional LysR family regulator
MDVDTQHLKAFVAIAQCGSFSSAAARLHLTQPAISKRMALLEQQVEARLFDRIGRHVHLSEAGQALLPRALTVLQEVEASYQDIAALQGRTAGRLSVAASHHIGLHYLPAHLREFTRSFPDVRLDLSFLDSEHAYEDIAQGRFDVALVTLAPEPDARFVQRQLWQDELRFVCGQRHPLAQRKSLTLRELCKHAAILPDAATYTTTLIKRLFDKQDLPLIAGMVANHLDTVKMLVSVGLGWGVLPGRLLDKQVKVLPLKHAPLLRPLGVIHHRQRNLSAAAQRFLAQLQRS